MPLFTESSLPQKKLINEWNAEMPLEMPQNFPPLVWKNKLECLSLDSLFGGSLICQSKAGAYLNGVTYSI
jgi:hypothetical protein